MFDLVPKFETIILKSVDDRNAIVRQKPCNIFFLLRPFTFWFHMTRESTLPFPLSSGIHKICPTQFSEDLIDVPLP